MMSAGGSAGQSGLWTLDVDESALGDDFSGRTWGVTVTAAVEAERVIVEERTRKKQVDAQRRHEADDAKLLGVVDSLTGQNKAAVRSTVRDLTGFNSARMTRAIERLWLAKVVEVVEVVVPTGIGGAATRRAKVIRRLAGAPIECPDSPDTPD